jgi:lipopolysaccharide/colanic/teichoic acid biosynthesis glycosyltransferase
MCLAAVGLVVLLPLLVLIAGLVRVSSVGTVLFRQERVGQHGRTFLMVKFRTMRAGTTGPGVTVSGDERITPLGRVLRTTKLDELPELWNVVRGDMSLVGPRPEVPRYVNLDDPMWRTVLRSRPGISDPVSVVLRNEEELVARASGDAETFYLRILQPWKLRGYAAYLKNRSMTTDLLVLLKTVLATVLPWRNPPPSIDELTRSEDGRD